MAVKSCVIDQTAKTLTIVMDLETPAPSASGKTMVVASSRGNTATTAVMNGKPITVGVNAYYANR